MMKAPGLERHAAPAAGRCCRRTRPNSQMPNAMPRMVTAVHIADLRETKSEPRRQITRQPDHDAVVAEVLHRAEDEHADADLGGRAVFDQQLEKATVHLARGFAASRKIFGSPTYRRTAKADERRGDETDDKHAAPADLRQQPRGHERGGSTPLASRDPHRSRPAPANWVARFGDQRHADAELAAKAEARDVR